MKIRIILYFFCFILNSCSDENIPENAAAEEQVERFDQILHENNSGEEPIEKENTDVYIGTIEEQSNSIIHAKDYKVILTVDSLFKMNENGILKVWIGQDSLEQKLESGMIKDETTIPSNLGSYATITPFAPDFEILNADEKKCYAIDPSGSSIIFTLIPNKIGSHRISAVVEIFKNSTCTGTSIPKTSRTLAVEVIVDNKKEFNGKMHELWTIFWEKFLTFWGALVALILGTILFVIRKKIKKNTGYEENEK
jgi:hypothetical protein